MSVLLPKQSLVYYDTIYQKKIIAIPSVVKHSYEEMKAVRGVHELKRGIGEFRADWSTLIYSDGLRLSDVIDKMIECYKEKTQDKLSLALRRKHLWKKAYRIFEKEVKKMNEVFQKEASEPPPLTPQEKKDFEDLLEVFQELLEEQTVEEARAECDKGIEGISQRVMVLAFEQALTQKPTPIEKDPCDSPTED